MMSNERSYIFFSGCVLAGSVLASNPVSYDKMVNYVQSQLAPKVYQVGDAVEGGVVVFTTDNGQHGLVVSNIDQSNSALFYQAASLVSDNALYDTAGQMYLDWVLPNTSQWSYICSALSSGKINGIANSFTLGEAYWTTTLINTDSGQGQYGYAVKIVPEQTAEGTIYVCVTVSVALSSSTYGYARAARVF